MHTLAVLNEVLASTGAGNVTLPNNITGDTTIQAYRDQSLMLLMLDAGAAGHTGPHALMAGVVGAVAGYHLPRKQQPSNLNLILGICCGLY